MFVKIDVELLMLLSNKSFYREWLKTIHKTLKDRHKLRKFGRGYIPATPSRHST
jgi:hypothetical protein